MNSLKRILFVSARSDLGGGTKHLNDLVQLLDSKYAFYVAAPTQPPYFELWSRSDKVHDYFLLPSRSFSLIKLFGLLLFVKKNKIDVIHSHGRGAGVYSRLIKFFLPSVIVFHTLHGVHNSKSIMHRVAIFLERVFVKYTDHFIHVSQGEQKIAVSTHVSNYEKSTVILNGVAPLQRVVGAKDLLNLSGSFVCVMVSRFDYAKNMQLAYRLVCGLINEPIVFLWVGDGDDKYVLEEQAKKDGANIIFAGFQTDVATYLSAADMLLSTSRWEGLPLNLLEGQSLGLPIVATNVVGNNEVVEHGKTGFLFSRESDGISHIKELLHNQTLSTSMGALGYENFCSHFTIDKMVNNTDQLYMRLLS